MDILIYLLSIGILSMRWPSCIKRFGHMSLEIESPQSVGGGGLAF
jgi:hypothetical protein